MTITIALSVIAGFLLLILWRAMEYRRLVGSVESAGAVSSRRPQVGRAYLETSLPVLLGRLATGIPVGEENFRSKLLYWGDAGVDSTYFSLSVLGMIGRLGHARRGLLREFRDPVASFVLSNFVAAEGGFKHHRAAWPTVYGTYSALATLAKLVGDEELPEYMSDRIGKGWRESILQFVERCRNSDGGYGEARFESSTISDTDAALRIRSRLSDSIAADDRRAVVAFVLSCLKSVGDEAKGFSNRPSDTIPSMCSGHYALNTLDLIATKEIDGRSPLSRSDRNMILNYVRLSAKEGGFASGPGGQPSVVYSDCALRILRGVANDDARVFIQLDDTVAFLNSRQMAGGFSDDGVTVANVHVTRSALKILETLTDLFPERQFLSEGTLSDVEEYVRSLYSPQDGAFRGYRALTSVEYGQHGSFPHPVAPLLPA